MNFADEVEQYTDDDLELIITTQRNLYSQDEWDTLLSEQCKRQLLKQKQYDEWVATRIPETIPCEKCDGPNPFSNDVCGFCGYRLDKAKYYTDEYYIDNITTGERVEESETNQNKYGFHYVVSFLIPLVGFIVGAIMLASDDPKKASCGKGCIISAILSVVISALCTLLLIA
jgi:hypothetical protein